MNWGWIFLVFRVSTCGITVEFLRHVWSFGRQFAWSAAWSHPARSSGLESTTFKWVCRVYVLYVKGKPHQAPTFFKPHMFRRLADRKIGGNWQKYYLRVSDHYKYHLINYLTSHYFMMLVEIQRKPSQGVANHLLSFLPLSLKASLARAGSPLHHCGRRVLGSGARKGTELLSCPCSSSWWKCHVDVDLWIWAAFVGRLWHMINWKHQELSSWCLDFAEIPRLRETSLAKSFFPICLSQTILSHHLARHNMMAP